MAHPSTWCSRRSLTAIALLALAGTGCGVLAQGGAKRGAVWRDDFAGGRPRAGEWTRCQQPFETNLGACASSAAGPGEQIYWDPALLRGGGDPVKANRGGGIRIVAAPITPAQRQLVTAALARQQVQPQHVGALTRAKWTSGWLQTKRSFGVGTTVTARLRPGAGPSAWSGLWMLNDPAHRRWPPEIDIAEVTNNPDGSMYVRQALHFTDAAGKKQVHNCPATLPRHDWIVAAVSRLPGAIRFSLNGKTSCTVPTPPGMNDPMQIILSQQVGGLAKPSTPNTAPFSTDVAWVEVTRN